MINALIIAGIVLGTIILIGLWSCLKIAKISDEQMIEPSQDKE